MKGEVAPITEEMRVKNPNIHFFEQKNPTWVTGTELPCIGRLGWKDLARFPVKLMRKPVSKGKYEAIVNQQAHRQGVLQ